MSSILKALEKAEEANSPKRVASEHDVIRARQARPVWVMPIAVLGGACVAALATFVAMGGFSKHGAPASPASPGTVAAVAKSAAPVSQPVAAGPAATAPLAVPAGTPPAPQTQAPIAQPAAQAKAAAAAAPGAAAGKPVHPQKVVAPVARARVSAKAPVTLNGQHGGTTGVAAPAPAVQPAAVQAAPVPPAAASAAAQPKVSGIAWQGNGESSFAVVNGRAVLQGGTVDGYKVLEIHQDRVRFSGSSGSFEVPMGTEEK